MIQLSERARGLWIARWLEQVWHEAKVWCETQGLWWAVSTTAHAVVLSMVLLLMGSVARPEPDVARIYTIDTAIAPPAAPSVEMPPSIEPPEAPQIDITVAGSPSNDAILADLTRDDIAIGGDGLDAIGVDSQDGIAPLESIQSISAGGTGGYKHGSSFGVAQGSGDFGGTTGFGHRDPNGKPMGTGVTRKGDRAVALALKWLARHQDSDGHWSLAGFSHHCSDGTCACKAGQSDTAATALALLPFLATGHTHKTGSYRSTIHRGLRWLTSQQKSDGDLRSGIGNMYSHGLATIALCEAYGMSKDKVIGGPAQQAINFIVAAQDTQGGGWRYEPRQPGDLSVVGWQLMALKSGMMAGLAVPSETIERTARYVKSVGTGEGGFGYQEPAAGPTMSAVGLLCSQYLGATRDDKTIRGGSRLLLANLPSNEAKNTYYWYYATQVMHNLYDSDWDIWNRRMRKVLVESQETKGCAAGSWSPDGHPHADQGGRVMVTALNTLSLEVYYRYLPLYRMATSDHRQ